MATELLRAIAVDPNAIEPRQRLARHYQSAYPISSEFFHQTAGYFDNSWPVGAFPQGTLYRCATEVGPQSRSVYLDLQRQFTMADADKTDAYVSAASKAIEAHGASCDLVIMWARAIIQSEATRVSEAETEKALRVALNIGEQYLPFHEGRPSPQLFLDVAYSFAERRDYVSAYVAAKWADDRLEAARDLDPDVRRGYADKIARALSTYAQRSRKP